MVDESMLWAGMGWGIFFCISIVFLLEPTVGGSELERARVDSTPAKPVNGSAFNQAFPTGLPCLSAELSFELNRR
jgi:hypothetical protein